MAEAEAEANLASRIGAASLPVGATSASFSRWRRRRYRFCAERRESPIRPPSREMQMRRARSTEGSRSRAKEGEFGE